MLVSLRSVQSHSTSTPVPVYSSSSSPSYIPIDMSEVCNPLLIVRFLSE